MGDRASRVIKSPQLTSEQLKRFLSLPGVDGPWPGVESAVPSQYFAVLFQYARSKGFLSTKDYNSAPQLTSKFSVTNALQLTINKRHFKDLDEFMNQFLQLPNQWNCSWAEIFYTRLLRTCTPLTNAEVLAIKRLTFFYCERAPGPLVPLAHAFLHYLTSHALDVDNALVGLPTSSLFQEYFEETRRGASPDVMKEYSTEQLLEQIMAWAALGEPARVGEEVLRFARDLEFRDLLHLVHGQLVLARVAKHKEPLPFTLLNSEMQHQLLSYRAVDTPLPAADAPGEHIIIARFIRREAGQVVVWARPDEGAEMTLSPQAVCPFNADMLTLLHTGKGMRRLVMDDIDELNVTLKDNVRHLLNEELRGEHQIDLKLLERTNDNDISILDRQLLLSALDALCRLQDSTEALQERVERHIKSTVNLLGSHLSLSGMFQPTRAEIIDTCAPYPYVVLALNRIDRYIALIRCGLDLIRHEVGLIQNGQLKARMIDWWLATIRQEVIATLREREYNFTAVNEDYIDRPPSDLQTVQKNYALISSMLSAAESEWLATRLLRPLKAKIYTQLDQFQAKLTAYLVAQPFSQENDYRHFQVDVFTRQLHQAQHDRRISLEEADTFRAILRDIDYLEQMKALEADFGTAPKGPPSDVVPVSGLILNYLHRMHMELRTVLEVWDPERQRAREERRRKRQRTMLVQSPVHDTSSLEQHSATSEIILSACPSALDRPSAAAKPKRANTMRRQKMPLKTLAARLPQPPPRPGKGRSRVAKMRPPLDEPVAISRLCSSPAMLERQSIGSLAEELGLPPLDYDGEDKDAARTERQAKRRSLTLGLDKAKRKKPAAKRSPRSHYSPTLEKKKETPLCPSPDGSSEGDGQGRPSEILLRPFDILPKRFSDNNKAKCESVILNIAHQNAGPNSTEDILASLFQVEQMFQDLESASPENDSEISPLPLPLGNEDSRLE